MASKTFDLTNGFKNTKYSPKKDDIVDIDFSNHDVSYKEAGKNIVVTVTDKFTNVYTSTATKTSKDAATGTFYSYKSGKKTVYTKSATHDEASKLEKGTFYTYKNGDVDVYTKEATHDVANTEVSSRSANDFYSNEDEVVITASQYNALSEDEKKEYSSVSTDTKVYSYTSGSDTIYSLDETHEVDNVLVPSDEKIYSYKSGNETIYSTSSVHSVANAEVKGITLYEKVTYDATWTAKGGESTEYEWKNALSPKTTEYVTKQGDDKFYYSDFKVTNDGSFNEATVKTNGKTDNYNVAPQTKNYTLTLVNAASKQNADSIKLTATGYNDFELLTANYTLEPGKKVNGTFLNETVTGTNANETFSLGTTVGIGTDTVNFKVTTSGETVTGFGHDTVKVSNGENLTLNLQGLATGESADKVAVSRSGDNLIVSATRGSDDNAKDLGQITIQGYANKGIGSVGLYNGITDITSLITTAVTTQQDATHKGNKFTGTVFADKATSTTKNETFSLGTTVGIGEDKVTFAGSFGKDTVNFVDGETLKLNFANIEGLQYAAKGNDLVITSDVKYYAIAEVTRDFVVDGNIRDKEGNLVKQSIVNNLESATYHKINGAVTDTIDLAAYKRLSAKGKADYEFVTGTIKLTLQTNVAHSNVTRYNEYVFATDSLYKMPKNYQWPEEKQFNTDRNVSIILNNADVVDATKSTGSTYQDETDQGLGAMTLKNMQIYKVVNDANPATITAEYLSALETAHEDSDPDKDTVAEGYFNKQVSGQVTVKNYMKLAEDSVYINEASLKTILQGGAEAQITVDYSAAKKGQTIKGTFLNEKITGSQYADKIYSNGGTDTITGGKGDDKMYAGTGADTFQIAKGDAAGKKGDTIYNAASADKVNFADGDNLTFAKSGNNLVVTHTDGTGDNKVVDNVTLANYFKSATPEAIKINDIAVTTRLTTGGAKLDISGKGKIAGTDFNDAIAGSAKADKITTGDGEDVITAGKGNDTITIDGTDKKTLIFDRASGKDTVVVTAGDDFTKADLLFDGIDVEGNKLTYDHSVNGNDLIVTASYKATEKSGSTPAQKASTATVTVKDYFADGLAGKVTIGGEAVNYATAKLNSNEADARLASTVDTTGNNIYDVISTTYKSQTGEGKKPYSTAIIVDESGNDLYNVASLDANTYINDKAGKDALNIKVSDPDNVCMIFDVLSKTAPESAALYKDNSLFIFDSHNLDFKEAGGLKAPVGGVEIANFIKVASNGKYSVGAGAIETINFSGNDESETWSAMSSKALDKVRADVANWLTSEGRSYSSAMDVINNGSKDDIQALLQIYNPEYTPQNA